MRDELLAVWPEGIKTVVDLGCRDCWHTSGLPGVKIHVGVDCWQPALDRGIKKASEGHLPGFLPICRDVVSYLEAQADGVFGAALAIDLLEHLAPPIAVGLLASMARVTRKFAAVWTTLGMIEQGPYDIDGNDNPYEQHLWGPTPKLFEDIGWEYNVYPNWHEERGGAILAWLSK